MARLKFVLGGFALVGLFIFVIAIGVVTRKEHRRAKIQEAPLFETQAVGLEKQKVPTEIKGEVPPEIKDDKFKLAQFYRSEGDVEKAISTLKEFIEEREDPAALTMLGECYIDKKQYELAEETLKKAIEIGPNSPYTIREYAALYIELGKYENALEQINEALKFASTPSDEAYAYFLFSKLYRAQNRIDAAIENAKKAIDLLPENIHFKGTLMELEKKKELESKNN